MRTGVLGRLTSGIALESGEGSTRKEGGVGGVARPLPGKKMAVDQSGTRVMAGR